MRKIPLSPNYQQKSIKLKFLILLSSIIRLCFYKMSEPTTKPKERIFSDIASAVRCLGETSADVVGVTEMYSVKLADGTSKLIEKITKKDEHGVLITRVCPNLPAVPK